MVWYGMVSLMDQISIKTPNPKCRLYWCLIEYWRYNQSCWYFRRPLLGDRGPQTDKHMPPTCWWCRRPRRRPPCAGSRCSSSHRRCCCRRRRRGWGRGPPASLGVGCRQLDGWNWTRSSKKLLNDYTVKKGYRFSRPQLGCHKPDSLCPGIIKLFPACESLVSDIPAGDGKTNKKFYSVS